MAQEFLDKTGLDALWAKLKNKFVNKIDYGSTLGSLIASDNRNELAITNLQTQLNSVGSSVSGKLDITDYNTWKSGVTSKLGSLDGDIAGVLNRANYINDTLETKINNVIGTASDTGDTVKGLSNRITSVNNNLQSQINSISGSSTDKVNVSDFNAYKQSIGSQLGSIQGTATGALQRANYVYDELQPKIETLNSAVEEKVDTLDYNNYKSEINIKLGSLTGSLYATDNRVENLFNEIKTQLDAMSKRIDDLEGKMPTPSGGIETVGRVQDVVDSGIYNQIFVDSTKVSGEYKLCYIDENDTPLTTYDEITQ